MYSFFVLGQIPGTSIIITFTMWMQLLAAVLALALLMYVRHHQFIKNYFPPTIGNDPTVR